MTKKFLSTLAIITILALALSACSGATDSANSVGNAYAAGGNSNNAGQYANSQGDNLGDGNQFGQNSQAAPQAAEAQGTNPETGAAADAVAADAVATDAAVAFNGNGQGAGAAQGNSRSQGQGGNQVQAEDTEDYVQEQGQGNGKRNGQASGGRGNGGQGQGQGMEYNVSSEPLSQAEAEALVSAIEEEYGAQALYQSVLDTFGDIEPFNRIVQSEAQHAQALINLAQRYGVAVPEFPSAVDLPTFNSLEEACAAGVQAEIVDAELYDELMPLTTHEDILRVYSNLQNASLNSHLPAFEACQ